MSRRAKSFTNRGFGIYADGEDVPFRGGKGVSLYESSLACEGAHLWLTFKGYPHDMLRADLENGMDPGVQITVTAATKLIDRLQAWIDDTESGQLIEPAEYGS